MTGEPYGYAANDPVNGTDPTGLYWGESVVRRLVNDGRSDAGTSASGTINYTTGNEVNDVVIVPVNSNGQFRIWASTATDVILDVAGYYTAPTNGTASSATLETVTPARTVDTRTSTGTCSPSCARLAALSQVKIGVRGIGGIPNDATSVVAFVSVIAPSATGFFRVNPVGTGVGTNGTATINYDTSGAGMTVIAPIASDGTITVAANTAADVVVDVTGYMTTPTWTYRYSSDGLRAATTSPTGAATEFTWTAHGGLPLLLGQHRGTATTWVIQGPGGQPVQQINPDNTVTWLHHDQLGSVRLGTNSSGNNVSARSWDAYGNPATVSGTVTPILGYAGEYTDTETGYLYLRARYYDPTSGQFLTRDPLFAMTGEPYGYTSGNPTNMVDPTGLFGWSDISDAVSDAKSWAYEHRGDIVTAASIGACVGFTGGVGTAFCVGLTVSALAVRSHQTYREQGWEAGKGDTALDAAVTFLTLGMVGGPASLADEGLARGFSSSSGVRFTPELGPWSWQRLAVRGGAAIPDVAGWSTQCFSSDGA